MLTRIGGNSLLKHAWLRDGACDGLSSEEDGKGGDDGGFEKHFE